MIRNLLIPVLLIGWLSSCALNPAGLWIYNYEDKFLNLSLTSDNRFFINTVSSNKGKTEESGRWLVSNRVLSCSNTNGKTYTWEIVNLDKNQLTLKSTGDDKNLLILRPVEATDYFGIWYAPDKLNLVFSKGGIFINAGTNAQGQRIFNKGTWSYTDGKLTVQTQDRQKRGWYVVIFGNDKMVLRTLEYGGKPAVENEYRRLDKTGWIGSWKQGDSKITFRDDGHYTASGANFGKPGTYEFSDRTLRFQQDDGKSTESEVLVYSFDKVILRNISSPIESVWLRVKPEK